MTHPPYSEAYLRQRRFYLLLPALTLPFLTLIYWKLLVENLDKRQSDASSSAGLQLSLPPADLSGLQNMDKLAYYRKADQDSASWAQQIKKDPYRQGEQPSAVDSVNSALMGLGAPGSTRRTTSALQTKTNGHSSPEKQLHQRLGALDKALTAAHAPSFESPVVSSDLSIEDKPQIAKLEKMMADMQGENMQLPQDPEMAQLDGMLNKLLQLQERDKTNPAMATGSAPVQRAAQVTSAGSPDDQVTLLAPSPDSATSPHNGQQGFFGLDQDPQARPQGGLTAVIERTQQLVSGNTIQLRLTSPLLIAGTVIAENTLIYGTASLSGERLKIKISTLRSGEQILLVNLSVYDLDGIEGIYIPGALSRTVVKQQLASQVQGYDLDAGGYSVGAQAASAGIQMGKMLLSRKSRLTQVTLWQGYKVILGQNDTTNP